MIPELQLLERHQEALAEQPVTWFDGPVENPLAKPSDGQQRLLADSSTQTPENFTNFPLTRLNVLFYPKAKERLHWWLAQLAAGLIGDKRLWLVGDNKGGIKSLPKRIKGHFHVEKLDSARHCSLYEVTPTDLTNLPNGTPATFEYQNHCFIAEPGVFSAGRLDVGTEVLLKVIPELKGQILEFGAGCGILTSQLAQQKDVSLVDALEIDLLAVRSTQKNLANLGLADKTRVYWSNGTANLPKKTYDAIVTNPPFHQGIKTTYAPTESFFSAAHIWLKPRGMLIWVANDFLDYRPSLAKEFKNIECLAHDKNFRVWQAQK